MRPFCFLKSFPVQEDNHLVTVCRYVERNPLRARLVRRAEDWRWSSLWLREHGAADAQVLLAEWPVPRRSDWLRFVNAAQTAAEEEVVRRSVLRAHPSAPRNGSRRRQTGWDWRRPCGRAVGRRCL